MRLDPRTHDADMKRKLQLDARVLELFGYGAAQFVGERRNETGVNAAIKFPGSYVCERGRLKKSP